MAIIIEEEKKNSNISSSAGWIVFLIVIALAVYYIFFAPSQSVIVPTPANLMSVSSVSQINIDTQDMGSSTAMGSLKQYIQPLVVASTSGRQNPFLVP
jgi:uncharacterized membrane protein YdfJ with MMPL/SSD domain